MNPAERRTLVRWLMVIPAAFAGWWATFLVGLGLLALGDSQCAPDQRISDACVASWFESYERVVFITCAAIAAALVVLLPALTAPSHRRRVAWAAFIWGGGTAVWLGVKSGAHLELLAALVAGLAAALIVHRYRIRITVR